MPSGTPNLEGRNTNGGTTHDSVVSSTGSTATGFVVDEEAVRATRGGATYASGLSAASDQSGLSVDADSLRAGAGTYYASELFGEATSAAVATARSSSSPNISNPEAAWGEVVLLATTVRNISDGPSYFSRISGRSSTLSDFDVDRESLRNIYTGASYFPRFDDITSPDFAPIIEVFDLIAGTTMTEIGSSQTLYVGLFEDSTELRVSLPLPTGTIQQLTVESSAAASASGDYVYTVMKNGVAQLMTISMPEGENSQSTSANQVVMGNADTFSIKLATASSAPSAYHRYSIKYTMTS